jgi:hypothetical protein
MDIDTNKRTVLEKDNWRKLPIHYACSHSAGATTDVIWLLLDSDADKLTILQKDGGRCLPIHHACRTESPVEVVKLLLDSDADKKSILKKDDDGWLPIHHACEANAPVEVVQLLLQASIWDRIERLGLEEWKMDLEERINSMTEEDSRREKVQEVYESLLNYELELAIWRAESCFNWNSLKSESIQEIEDLRATDAAFDPAGVALSLKPCKRSRIRGFLFRARTFRTQLFHKHTSVKPLIHLSTRESVESETEASICDQEQWDIDLEEFINSMTEEERVSNQKRSGRNHPRCPSISQIAI